MPSVSQNSFQLPGFPSSPVTQISNFQMPAVSQTNFQLPRYPPPVWFPPPQPSYMPFTASAPAPQVTPSLPPTSPFTLCKIAGNISICAGCHNKYPKHPSPPDDLCIKHQEWRKYMPAGSQTPQCRFGNVYYHFNPRCVRLRCPEFIPNYMEIPPEVCSQLDASHRGRLQQDFFIYLP